MNMMEMKDLQSQRQRTTVVTYRHRLGDLKSEQQQRKGGLY